MSNKWNIIVQARQDGINIREIGVVVEVLNGGSDTAMKVGMQRLFRDERISELTVQLANACENVSDLEAENKKLRFIIDEGLGPEDLRDDH